MTRIDWFDDKTSLPVIDEQVQKLAGFVEAMADGVIEKSELERQQSSVVQAMKAVQGDLNDTQHEKVTRLLVELTAACQEAPTYLDKYYALQPGGLNGAKRLVVIRSDRREWVPADWIDDATKFASLVWTEDIADEDLGPNEYIRTNTVTENCVGLG